MKRMPGSLQVYIFAVVLLLVVGLQDAAAQLDKNTLWRDAVVTDLDVDFGGTGFHARWRFHRCHCGDLQVQVEQVAQDGTLTGELLMVDGQVLLARGFGQQGTNIVSLMQAPSLMLQLVYSLLNRSEPEGPYAVGKKRRWDVEEVNKNFKLNTGFATGIFAAPWRVRGSGWKTETGQRRFELMFEFGNQLPGQVANTDTMTFSGKLDYRKQGFPYPESTSLEGWRIQWFSLGEDESKLVSEGLTLAVLRERAGVR